MTYTKDQKKEYFTGLRKKWADRKKLAENSPELKIQYAASQGNGKVSPWSWMFIKMEMNQLGLEGDPYIDCKTFKRWHEEGYKVKKGEHAKLTGLVWMSAEKDKNGEENLSEYVYPKEYKLFHRSQVESIV